MAEDDGHSHGPQVRPILPVRSLDEVAPLHAALGLDVTRYDEGYAWVSFRGHEVWHLRVVDGLDPATNPTSIYVFVDDPDATHAALEAAGLAPSAVETRPWGMRELEVRGPSGNLVRLGCRG